MSTENLAHLVSILQTKERMTHVVSSLESLRLQLYSANVTSGVELMHHFVDYQTYEGIMRVLELDPSKEILVQNLDRALGSLIDMLRKISVVTVTVATTVTTEMLAFFQQWFSTNLHYPVLLEFTVDTSILGGAVLAFNGKQSDYSLRVQYESLLG